MNTNANTKSLPIVTLEQLAEDPMLSLQIANDLAEAESVGTSHIASGIALALASGMPLETAKAALKLSIEYANKLMPGVQKRRREYLDAVQKDDLAEVTEAVRDLLLSKGFKDIGGGLFGKEVDIGHKATEDDLPSAEEMLQAMIAADESEANRTPQGTTPPTDTMMYGDLGDANVSALERGRSEPYRAFRHTCKHCGQNELIKVS
jgi:hypothetical protein